jgi:hypothetical protein
MKDFLEKLIDKPKGVYALAVLTVIVLILYFVFKNQISGFLQNLKTSIFNQRTLDEQITETGETLSYSNLQFQAYSNRLYLAMKGLGTDDEAILSVFNDMRNSADVLKLIATFGIRDEETLAQWLHGEAPWYELGSIVKKVNSLLTAKNITYQF